MNSNVYPLKNTNSHYLLLITTIIPLCNSKISLIFLWGQEHVYTRLEVNSNQFGISIWDRVSLRCDVTSLSAFTWIQAEWNLHWCKFHFEFGPCCSKRDVNQMPMFLQFGYSKSNIIKMWVASEKKKSEFVVCKMKYFYSEK